MVYTTKMWNQPEELKITQWERWRKQVSELLTPEIWCRLNAYRISTFLGVNKWYLPKFAFFTKLPSFCYSVSCYSDWSGITILFFPREGGPSYSVIQKYIIPLEWGTQDFRLGRMRIVEDHELAQSLPENFGTETPPTSPVNSLLGLYKGIHDLLKHLPTFSSLSFAWMDPLSCFPPWGVEGRTCAVVHPAMSSYEFVCKCVKS